MKIARKGAIILGLILAAGIGLIIPVYVRTQLTDPKTLVLLSFSIISNDNLPDWCDGLSSTLKKYGLKGVVFVSGNVADQYPKCVSTFSSNDIDIGTQTYNYANLTLISDYSKALSEVRKGKEAVNKAGNIESKSFKAPFDSTDENIYSLLTRSGILADFSYDRQYNKYENGKFIKYDLTAYDGSTKPEILLDLLSSDKKILLPILLDFNNSDSIDYIDNILGKIKLLDNVEFVNATELTSLDLTIERKG
jgi:hypothetical protein